MLALLAYVQEDETIKYVFVDTEGSFDSAKTVLKMYDGPGHCEGIWVLVGMEEDMRNVLKLKEDTIICCAMEIHGVEMCLKSKSTGHRTPGPLVFLDITEKDAKKIMDDLEVSTLD